jgi:hypothetical protein
MSFLLNKAVIQPYLYYHNQFLSALIQLKEILKFYLVLIIIMGVIYAQRVAETHHYYQYVLIHVFPV